MSTRTTTVNDEPTETTEMTTVRSDSTAGDNTATKDKKDNDDTNPESDVALNKTLYMCVYILSIAYYGICLSLSGAIYVELTEQLNTSSSTMAYILSCRSISFVVGGLTGAYIIDKYKETHKFFAVAVFCSGVSLSIMPFVTSIPVMFVLWVPIGFAMGCAELSNSVYIFRLFPKKGGGRMLLFSVAMYHFGKLSAPLIVQASIELFGSYKASMWVFAVFALGYASIVPWLKTPPYDKLRALKREVAAQREKLQALALEAENAAMENTKYTAVDNTDKAALADNDDDNVALGDYHGDGTADIDLNELLAAIAEKLKGDKKYKRTQWMIITFLIICYALFSMIRNGFTTFITTYVSDYLGKNDSIGRYLIVTFYLGQFIVALVGSAFKNLNPRKSVIVSFSCFLVCTILFLLFGNELFITFITFALAGFCGGVTYPFLYAWCELIRPLTGILSCLFTLAYGCGDAIISTIVAQVIDGWGVRYYSLPLVICSIIACIVCIVNSIIYMKYKKYEHGVLTEIEGEMRNKKTSSNNIVVDNDDDDDDDDDNDGERTNNT